jgi:hypothetical protein
MNRACSTNGREEENMILVGKPEGRRPLGRSRCWWVDNIKLDFGEIELGDLDWINLTQDRDQWMTFVNMVMNL